MPDSTDLVLQERLAALHRGFVAGAGPGAAIAAHCAGVALPAGETIGQVASAPLLVDVLSGSARHAGERYPGSTWRPDHVVVSNNPFQGGLSLDTVIVLAPVVAAAAAATRIAPALAASAASGRGALMGFVGLAVQYPDIGAMAQTAFTLRRETRHEGFCLSLLLIAVPDNRLPEMLLAMLRANVRDPDQTARWLAAQVAAARDIAPSLAVSENSPLAPAGQASPAPDAADCLGRIPQGRCAGTAGLQPVGDARNDAQVRAEVTVSAAAVHVALSVIDADNVAAECNAPLAATRAAVLTALSDVAGVPPWKLARWLRLDTGGSGIVDAAYPAAVGQGAVTAFACYEAVRYALREAGAAAGAARSFAAFAGRT